MNKGVIVFLLLFVMWVSSVSAQTPFYQGKTITIIAAAKAGDVYDLYPRLVAEFMPKHIPGSPNIIIQNVAGAAGLIGTNQVYNIAKPDGLTLGAIYPALYFEQLAKRPEVKFDWTKFNWIGSTVSSNSLMYMRADTPYKTIEDVRTATTPPKCGATGVTSTAFYMPKLLEDAIGTKFDVVSGYVAARTSISLWNAAKSCAVLLPSTRSLAGNHLSLGAKKTLCACSIKPEVNEFQGLKTFHCLMN